VPMLHCITNSSFPSSPERFCLTSSGWSQFSQWEPLPSLHKQHLGRDTNRRISLVETLTGTHGASKAHIPYYWVSKPDNTKSNSCPQSTRGKADSMQKAKGAQGPEVCATGTCNHTTSPANQRRQSLCMHGRASFLA
jgi:hypothetical protein